MYRLVFKRLVDFLFSFIFLVISSPLILIIAIVIKVDSKGGALFTQNRVGKNKRIFKIYKFRTMFSSEKDQGSLITGNQDLRITRVGKFLRRFKLDEIPQLFNVLKGDMSIIGPRPEVPRFVKNFADEENRIFLLRPGLSDLASIIYHDETRYLPKKGNIERYYEENVLHKKLKLNMIYIENISFCFDLKILFLTILVCLGFKKLSDYVCFRVHSKYNLHTI